MRLLLILLFVLFTPSLYAAESTIDSVVTPVSGEAKALFEKAQKLFDEKNYKDCKDILSSLVAEHPLDDFVPQARLMLAKVQDDFEVSVAQLREVAEQYDDKPEGMQAQKELGDRFYLADKYEEAIDAYKDFLEKYEKAPMAIEVHYWMGCSYLAAGKTDPAIEEFKKVLDKGKETTWAPKALLGMGNAYFSAQKFSDAENRYLRILDQYALYEELNLVYLKLGETYEMEKKWKQAYASYDTLISRFPKSMEVAEAQPRLEALSKLHPELKGATTIVPTPTITVTMTDTPILPAQATPMLTVSPVVSTTPETTVAATPAATEELEGEAAEPAQQEEVVDQPVLRTTPFHVQVGVYGKKANLQKAEKAIRKAGYKYYVLTVQRDAQMLYKLRVGHFASRSSAQKVANILARKTKEKAIVVEE